MHTFSDDTTLISKCGKAPESPQFKLSIECADIMAAFVSYAQCQLADKNCPKTMQPFDSTKFLQVDTKAMPSNHRRI
jgi:hypothetical protein